MKLTLEDVNGVRIADAVALLVLTNISGGISESEEVLFGSDLFAYWCQNVIGSPPRAVETKRWEVVDPSESEPQETTPTTRMATANVPCPSSFHPAEVQPGAALPRQAG